jgi:predicted nucleic acid-binding Zn ribbon protein
MKKKRTSKGFDSLSDVLQKLASRYPSLGKRITEATAVSKWPEAVGETIAKHAHAMKVERSELWIEVDHPIWQSELHHRKRQILDRLNEGLSEDAKVKDLKLIAPRRY